MGARYLVENGRGGGVFLLRRSCRHKSREGSASFLHPFSFRQPTQKASGTLGGKVFAPINNGRPAVPPSSYTLEVKIDPAEGGRHLTSTTTAPAPRPHLPGPIRPMPQAPTSTTASTSIKAQAARGTAISGRSRATTPSRTASVPISAIFRQAIVG